MTLLDRLRHAAATVDATQALCNEAADTIERMRDLLLRCIENGPPGKGGLFDLGLRAGQDPNGVPDAVVSREIADAELVADALHEEIAQALATLEE